MNLKIAWLLTLLFLIPKVSAQESDAERMKAIFTAEFNRVLVEEMDTRALARSPILDEMAQQISDTIACSDEGAKFNIPEEVIDLGYVTYPGDTTARTTQLPLAYPIVNTRPIEDIATLYTPTVFEININQPGRFYRELGVGVTPCVAEGGGVTPQYALFVILGAQPDVIPVVIEYGTPIIEADTVPITVMLSIHQENSRQRPGIFGRAATMRLSDTPLDEMVEPLAYEPRLPWTLDTCGEHTVYYELTDLEGITVEGETSVEVVCQ